MKIDSRRYGPKKLCSRIRNAVGSRVYMSELVDVLVPDASAAVRRLVLHRLAKVESVKTGGRVRLQVTFAEPNPRLRPKLPVPQYPGEPPTRRKQFLKRTSIVWVLGQLPKECRTNRTPRPGVLSFIKLGRQIELVRFVGPVRDGWYVQPV